MVSAVYFLVFGLVLLTVSLELLTSIFRTSLIYMGWVPEAVRIHHRETPCGWEAIVTMAYNLVVRGASLMPCFQLVMKKESTYVTILS